MAIAQRSFASRGDSSRLDDDDDDSLYDPEWLARGKKVVRDGGVVKTSIMLMDGAPNPRALNDASRHRPHQVFSDSAETRAAIADAEAAYEARNNYLRDAWRGPSNPPPPDDDGDAEDAEAARAAYKDRLSNAWRQRSPPSSLPPGNPFTTPPPRGGDWPAAINAATARRAGGGGVFPRPGGEAEAIEAARRRRPATDADPDAAYREYCDRISNGWRR
jgi:hypothetical protein